MRSVATDLVLDTIDIRAAQPDAVDTRGLPSVDCGTTVWNVPSFFPRDPDSMGLLFLDELSAAPALVQSALLQLILDRRLGDYVLPTGWRIVAAGNTQKDGAGIGRFNSALANRFAHVDVEVDNGDWLDWATRKLHPIVIAFIQSFPDHLHNVNPKILTNATPRTWEFVSRAVFANEAFADAEETLAALIPGIVGPGVGSEFLAFLRMADTLAKYDDIVSSPDGAMIPVKLDALWVVVNMLAHRGKAADAREIFMYLERLPKEFQKAAVQLFDARQSILIETPNYSSFAATN